MHQWCKKQGKYGQEVIESFTGMYQRETEQKRCTLDKVSVKSHKELSFVCMRCGLPFERQARLITQDNVRGFENMAFVCRKCAQKGFDDRDSVSLAEWLETDGKRIGIIAGDNTVSAEEFTTKSVQYYNFKCDGYVDCPGHRIRIDSLCNRRYERFQLLCQKAIKDTKFTVQDWAFVFWCYPFQYNCVNDKRVQRRLWCGKLTYNCCEDKGKLGEILYTENDSRVDITLFFNECSEEREDYTPRQLTYLFRTICLNIECTDDFCEKQVNACISKRRRYNLKVNRQTKEVDWNSFIRKYAYEDSKQKTKIKTMFQKKILYDKKFTARVLKTLAKGGTI